MTLSNLQQTYWLFGIFTGILIFASTVGFILKQRSLPQPSPVIDNLNARINAWWIMLLVLGSAILLGNLAFIVLFALILICEQKNNNILYLKWFLSVPKRKFCQYKR